ncbi:Uncharacterised protein [Chryseobacterium gleum]|uniref:Uncharacterized protein n=2 Tax=Chryseobacterium gleum TaxID=250 RepID=A0A448B2A3_CHRGE|nr:hypothetical protein [Chryseobacterium gleum]EFK33252.1 hypothetical protein HMPREF0204_12320 [Chryseobacterium gleum ATCC 35910]QQY34053.1 hypothetical protein I6I60_09935 [Chryseobacterium gleum]VEE07404.1 Uncharacterised protein [Chryseobacterium gleum]
MKKILIAALFVAGTTLVFAKDDVQKHEVKTTTTKVEQNSTSPQLDSNEKPQSFVAECKDVTIATTKVDGETVIISTCETTYPCESGGTNVYVVNV